MFLKRVDAEEAEYLLVSDNDGFTDDYQVSRLTVIKEHVMSLRAIKTDVSEPRIARSLNGDVATIRQKHDLLDGICPEAVELLKDRRAPGTAFRERRKVSCSYSPWWYSAVCCRREAARVAQTVQPHRGPAAA